MTTNAGKWRAIQEINIYLFTRHVQVIKFATRLVFLLVRISSVKLIFLSFNQYFSVLIFLNKFIIKLTWWSSVSPFLRVYFNIIYLLRKAALLKIECISQALRSELFLSFICSLTDRPCIFFFLDRYSLLNIYTYSLVKFTNTETQ